MPTGYASDFRRAKASRKASVAGDLGTPEGCDVYRDELFMRPHPSGVQCWSFALVELNDAGT